MINIYIHGLKNGLYDIDMSVPVEEVEDLYPEFFGLIDIKGQLRIINKRYAFSGTAECKVKLVCDISLTEFVECLKAELKVSFLADTDVFLQMDNDSGQDTDEHVIHEDDKYIDISREVREELTVNLPMKRVAPGFRDKDIEEIYPEFAAGSKKSIKPDNEIDDRWAVLKNLKIN